MLKKIIYPKFIPIKKCTKTSTLKNKYLGKKESNSISKIFEQKNFSEQIEEILYSNAKALTDSFKEDISITINKTQKQQKGKINILKTTDQKKKKILKLNKSNYNFFEKAITLSQNDKSEETNKKLKEVKIITKKIGYRKKYKKFKNLLEDFKKDIDTYENQEKIEEITKKIYTQIETAKKLGKDGYELHHIVFRSNNGSNKPNNLFYMPYTKHRNRHTLFKGLLPHQQISKILDINKENIDTETKEKLSEILLQTNEKIYENGIFKD